MITAKHLTTGNSTSDTDSFSTDSISAGKDKLILIFFLGRETVGNSTPNVESVSGLGLDWEEVETLAHHASIVRRISLYRAMGNPSSGSITVDWDRSCNQHSWTVVEFDRVDKSGSNGENAIINSASNTENGETSLSVSLESFSSENNATFGACYGDDPITEGDGFTELGYYDAGSYSPQSQWKNSPDTTVDWTLGSTARSAGIAAEIVAPAEVEVTFKPKILNVI